MPTSFRQSPIGSRRTERIPFHARLRLTTLDGRPAAPLGRCTNLGLGGLRIVAAEGLPPGTPVRVELTLPSGALFEAQGRVAWLRTTLHPTLLGAPTGSDDDAQFGIAFDEMTPERLLPIARLLAARDAERRRARRIRRRHAIRIHA
jgi:hypothetical protein